jgi:hypothetical protein
MPTLAVVDGVLIMMFWNDHAPPHFHARFAGQECRVDLATCQVLEGNLPAGKLKSVQEWARDHQAELAAAWRACRQHRKPGRIDG